jgi:hypothetical protein
MPETTAAALSAPAPHEHIAAIILGYWQSRALAVAAELELADSLAEGPVSVDTLAERTKTDPSCLFRLMRALESIGIFRQVSPRVFANTAASNCIRKGEPASQWAYTRLILSKTERLYDTWANLGESIETGQIAFDQMNDCSYWQFLERNPAQSSLFNQAMRSLSAPLTASVTAAYDWSRFPVIADIGGGIGSQLVDVLNTHTSCRGILFDRQEVVANAMPHDRVECIGGDFLKGVPQGADAYLLRWILIDWTDNDAITILNNVRSAMKADSRLALIEYVIPETPDFHVSKWVDLHMLVTVGGRARTAAEYGHLLRHAGLEAEQVVSTAGPVSIIIARRQA